MSRINSVSISDKMNDLFVCGDWQPNEATDDMFLPNNPDIEYQAAVARINDDGRPAWILRSSDAHPFYTTATPYA